MYTDNIYQIIYLHLSTTTLYLSTELAMTMSCYFLPPFPTLCVKVLLTLHLLDAPFSGKLRFTSCFSSDLVNKNIEYWMNEWKMRLFARLRQRERNRSLRYRPCDATAEKKNNLRMKETHFKKWMFRPDGGARCREGGFKVITIHPEWDKDLCQSTY